MLRLFILAAKTADASPGHGILPWYGRANSPPAAPDFPKPERFGLGSTSQVSPFVYAETPAR